MIKNSPIGSLPGVCRIKTGNYLGDGSTGLSITGMGFTPNIVIIFVFPLVATSVYPFGIALKAWGNLNYIYDPNYTPYWSSTIILTIGSDGFTVTDSNNDYFPNKNGEKYSYICLA